MDKKIPDSIKLPEKPFVSVVIPTYNRKHILRTTLLSFNSQSYNHFEIIVADDGSTDGTLKKHLEKLIEEHVKFHKNFERNNVCAVRGKAIQVKSKEEIMKIEYVPENKINAPLWENSPFRAFITNNISVNKSAFDQVNGFDEDFTEYGRQDVELGYRLHKLGYKFKYNPNAIGYLVPSSYSITIKTGFKNKCNKRRQLGHSSVIFYKKHPGFHMSLQMGVNPIVNLSYFIFSRMPWLISFLTKKAEKYRQKNIRKAFVERPVLYYFFCMGVVEKLKELKNG